MIPKEKLCEELKKAQLSLVNETDLNTEIHYCWDFIPEKLTPGHRQRGKERIELHIAFPFILRRMGNESIATGMVKSLKTRYRIGLTPLPRCFLR